MMCANQILETRILHSIMSGMGRAIIESEFQPSPHDVPFNGYVYAY